MRRVLVVAPHPDDETLGCGGTLLRHRRDGDVLLWCIATEMSGLPNIPAKRLAAREMEIQSAAKAFGFQKVFRLGFPAAGLDKVPARELHAAMAKVLKAARPDLVYVPHSGDVHGDHAATFAAAWSACKAFRAPYVKEVRAMEIPSETEQASPNSAHAFAPNCFVNISPYLQRKLKLLSLWKGEMGRHPFPRSRKAVQALALWRGAQADYPAAEAFQILKQRY